MSRNVLSPEHLEALIEVAPAGALEVGILLEVSASNSFECLLNNILNTFRLRWVLESRLKSVDYFRNFESCIAKRHCSLHSMEFVGAIQER